MARRQRYSDEYSSDDEHEYESASNPYCDEEEDLQDDEDKDDYEVRPPRESPVPKQRTVFPYDLQSSFDGESKDFHGRSPPPANKNKVRFKDERRHSDGENRGYDEDRGNFSDVPRRSDGEGRRQRNQRERDYDGDNRGYSDGEARRNRDWRVNNKGGPRRNNRDDLRDSVYDDGERFPLREDHDDDRRHSDEEERGYGPRRVNFRDGQRRGNDARYREQPQERERRSPQDDEWQRNYDASIDYEDPQPLRNNTRGRADRERIIKDRMKKGNPPPQGRKGDFQYDYNQERFPKNKQHYQHRYPNPRKREDWSPRENERDRRDEFRRDYLDDQHYYPDRRGCNREPLYESLHRARKFRDGQDVIPPDTLVKILVNERDFRATLLHLHEAFRLPLTPLRKLIASNGQMFRQIGEAVQLKIDIKICSSHNGPNGCANRSTCTDLHICAKYAENKCKNDNCIMGHKWLTNRNIKIINGLQLGNIPNDIVEKVMKLSVTSRINSQIEVCLNYNNKGCRRPNCPKLHVCYSFIKGLSQCSRQNCQLNHDLLASDCCRLLEAGGIDVNESPRDVLVALLDANPTLRNRAEKTESADQQGAITTSAVVDNTSRENKVKRNKPKKIRTVWTYESKGDVDIEEICYDSVESRCNNESTGCQRLHALEHYHWQVSESGKSWINLQPHQVRSLEVSFCDVNKDGCDLPPFDPQQVQGFHGSLITLLGRATWSTDFKTMTISDSKKSRTLKIRRLCTQRVPGKNVDASTYVWYFLDKQQNWVKYGEIDTLGAKDLVSSATSADIEKQYLRGAPTMTFNNSQFSYIIDYKHMTQTNQHTQVARDVRRRPVVHLKDEQEKEEEEGEENHRRLPAEWEKMQPNERLKRVNIPNTSDEYKKVVQLLANTVASPNVTKVERIQNRFHWNAFQNKVAELSSIYGEDAKLDVRQLFHGTSHTVVPQICSENFDPRLHGQAAGQAYGQGTYFARDATLSLGYCKADASSQKYMFIAKVAVGSITTGNSSMARPPINPATKAPFDSTGDNAANPSIIVKYDKAEYYPEYIITLK